MTTSDAAAIAGDVRALRQQLMRQLTRQLAARAEAAVGAACDELQEALVAHAADDYDVYHACCWRLLAYIAEHMATSPDFAQQMERIVLLSHSGASRRVLHSVATKRVWFHRNDLGSDESATLPAAAAAAAAARATATANPAHSDALLLADSESENKARDAKPLRVKEEPVPAAAATTPHAPKRRSPAAPSPERSKAKKPRPIRRTAMKSEAQVRDTSTHSRMPLTSSSVGRLDDDAEDEEVDAVAEAPSDDGAEQPRDTPRVSDRAAAADVERMKAASREHLGDLPDYLLNFDDPIRGLCDVDERTPAQTKAFKARLRRAISFVDAQACKPPPGSVCTRNCRKIKAVMCARTIPCSNPTCRQWHDVEVHLTQCTNMFCELDKRIAVRETMHKIAAVREQLDRSRTKLTAKVREFKAAEQRKANPSCERERERLREAALLTDEVEQLKLDVGTAEAMLEEQNDTLDKYWRCLAAMGIAADTDAEDGFPDPCTHYAPEKKQKKQRKSGARPRLSTAPGP